MYGTERREIGEIFGEAKRHSITPEPLPENPNKQNRDSIGDQKRQSKKPSFNSNRIPDNLKRESRVGSINSPADVSNQKSLLDSSKIEGKVDSVNLSENEASKVQKYKISKLSEEGLSKDEQAHDGYEAPTQPEASDRRE